MTKKKLSLITYSGIAALVLICANISESGPKLLPTKAAGASRSIVFNASTNTGLTQGSFIDATTGITNTTINTRVRAKLQVSDATTTFGGDHYVKLDVPANTSGGMTIIMDIPSISSISFDIFSTVNHSNSTYGAKYFFNSGSDASGTYSSAYHFYGLYTSGDYLGQVIFPTASQGITTVSVPSSAEIGFNPQSVVFWFTARTEVASTIYLNSLSVAWDC
jgi:hypothetical protein